MKSPNDTQVPMPMMGESKYLLQSHTAQNHSAQQNQDLTPCPYSAVSSFNLPPYCDASLTTPITTRSPSLAVKMEVERDIKMSPSTLSPNFPFLPSEDDYGSGRYDPNPPMKHKSPSEPLFMSTWDSSFPQSPHVCPEPFYGSYGVSATPVSGRSDSSPSLNPSPPHLYSTGGLSNASSSLTRQPTPAQSTSNNMIRTQAPILIAPSPSSLRPATKQDGGPYRQNSLQSISTAPSSATLAQRPFPESVGSLPPKGKKRKSPNRDELKHIVLSEDKTMEEELLFDLRLKKQIPWNDVTARFNEITGKAMKKEALQMKLNRTIKRLRVWREEDEKALNLAVKEFDKNKWEKISASMLKHGCMAKWPKELCEGKWNEMHPEEKYSPYEISRRHRDSEDWGQEDGTYSDDMLSACRSLNEHDSAVQMSAISTATMDEVRSRAASDASSHMRHQQRQQQLMFDHQQRQNSWGADG